MAQYGRPRPPLQVNPRIKIFLLDPTLQTFLKYSKFQGGICDNYFTSSQTETIHLYEEVRGHDSHILQSRAGFYIK